MSLRSSGFNQIIWCRLLGRLTVRDWRPMADPAGKRQEIVVFSIVRDSRCQECGAELWKGSFLRMEDERPLCMGCADLDHLVFLPRGDAALTRRAKKYSSLWAVVVRFSRARKRYERQGLLVDDEALGRAEVECLEDAEARALRWEREAKRRSRLDEEYVAEFARQLRERYPRCPDGEEQIIAARACQKYSGRIGRTAAAKTFDPEAIELAVVAHVRHGHTEYDSLLLGGWDRRAAREEVWPTVEATLAQWRPL